MERAAVRVLDKQARGCACGGCVTGATRRMGHKKCFLPIFRENCAQKQSERWSISPCVPASLIFFRVSDKSKSAALGVNLCGWKVGNAKRFQAFQSHEEGNAL